MGTREHQREYDEKLVKYLSGEMSGEEFRAFQKEISSSDETLRRTEMMKKQWKALERFHGSPGPDARQAWEKLHGRLEGEGLLPAADNPSRRLPVPVFTRIAAAIVVLVALAAILYYTVDREPATRMVQLSTASESNTLIKTLADGSVVYLDRNSRFSYPGNFKADSRTVELQGKAFFDITPDPAKPFIIETGKTLIRVLGTSFHVITGNGSKFELMVERGTVRVTLKDDPRIVQLVTAGEKIAVAENRLIKSKITGNEDTAWYKQRIHFKDEMLGNIIPVLNRNFSVNFATADEETGRLRLTVTFDRNAAGSIAELLCATLNLKSQAINGTIVFSKNRN